MTLNYSTFLKTQTYPSKRNLLLNELAEGTKKFAGYQIQQLSFCLVAQMRPGQINIVLI